MHCLRDAVLVLSFITFLLRLNEAVYSEFNEISKVDIIDILKQKDNVYVRDGSLCTATRLKYGRVKQTVKGMVARTSCRRRYVLVGKSYTFCIGGEWTPRPICLTLGCDITSRLLRASSPHRQTKVAQQQTVLIFSCDENYVLQGDSAMYCSGDKRNPRWIGTPPACVAKDDVRNTPANIIAWSSEAPTTDLPTSRLTSSRSTLTITNQSSTDTGTSQTNFTLTVLGISRDSISTVIPTSVSSNYSFGYSSEQNGTEAITDSMAAFQNELGFLGEIPDSRWFANLKVTGIVLGCILFIVGTVIMLYLVLKRRMRMRVRADEYGDFRFEPLHSGTG